MTDIISLMLMILCTYVRVEIKTSASFIIRNSLSFWYDFDKGYVNTGKA